MAYVRFDREKDPKVAPMPENRRRSLLARGFFGHTFTNGNYIITVSMFKQNPVVHFSLWRHVAEGEPDLYEVTQWEDGHSVRKTVLELLPWGKALDTIELHIRSREAAQRLCGEVPTP